jgi:hypothetical protein
MNIKGTANEFFKRYREQNVPAMIELFESGATVEYPPAKLSGDVKDIGSGSWSVLIDAFPDLTNEVGRVWSDEAARTVFVDVFIGGTQVKDIWGIVNQNKRYWMRHLFVFEMNDEGKITHLTSFWDNSDWWSQLGKNTIA